MTDVHCHILPGVDDGSQNWETTLAMCRLARNDGIGHIVATPHANYRYVFERERHLERLHDLQQRVPEIRFSLGCDFHVSHENVADAVEHPSRYVIGDTRYLLVEFSDFQTPHQMTDTLFRLHAAGFGTVITHPERNPIIEQYPALPQEFAAMGSAIQITASALSGDWGRRAKKTCESLLKQGLVSVIASDAHEAKRRTPILSQARKAASKIVGSVAADTLVEGNPAAILNNQRIV